ncbi:MAG: hypothetical protein KME64_15105 [Scytonematopsis contorta HA4267-MV1]|jgi:hypothetical protein|nr:hypothetical protein [Scytonematopsis contorta HA4267-MV1]
MSTEASTHLILAASSEELIVSEPWTIDTYADGLMNELFSDIDDILEGRGYVQTNTMQREYLPVQAAKLPQFIVQQETPHAITQTVSQPRNLQVNQVNTVVVDPNSVRKVVKKQKPSQKSWVWLGKLLTFGATVGVALGSVLWLLNSGTVRIASNSSQQALEASSNALPKATPADAQSQLVEYMLGALSVIERNEQAKNREKSVRPVAIASAATTPTSIASALPPVRYGGTAGTLPPNLAANTLAANTLAANNASVTPTPSTRVIERVERVFIPVYQAPQPMRYMPPTIAGVTLPPVPGVAIKPEPKLTSPKANVAKASGNGPLKTALSQVRQAAKQTVQNTIQAATNLRPVAIGRNPVILGEPKAPTLPRFASIRPVAPPKLPVATAPERQRKPAATTSDVAPPVRQEVASTVTTPTPSHILQGLLEGSAKEKSAALFSIDGASRRIDIGESIGSSGWTLVGVSQGEALIRRNGEVRSIYAGQKF